MNIIRERQSVGCGERILELLQKENTAEMWNYNAYIKRIYSLIPQTAIRSRGIYAILRETKIISCMSLTIR